MDHLIEKYYDETLALLRSKMSLLQSLTSSLMKNETLSKAEIEKILN